MFIFRGLPGMIGEDVQSVGVLLLLPVWKNGNRFPSSRCTLERNHDLRWCCLWRLRKMHFCAFVFFFFFWSSPIITTCRQFPVAFVAWRLLNNWSWDVKYFPNELKVQSKFRTAKSGSLGVSGESASGDEHKRHLSTRACHSWAKKRGKNPQWSKNCLWVID